MTVDAVETRPAAAVPAPAQRFRTRPVLAAFGLILAAAAALRLCDIGGKPSQVRNGSNVRRKWRGSAGCDTPDEPCAGRLGRLLPGLVVSVPPLVRLREILEFLLQLLG